MSRRGMTSQLWWLSIVENSPGVEDECSKPMKRAFNTVITRKCNDQEKNMLARKQKAKDQSQDHHMSPIKLGSVHPERMSLQAPDLPAL